MLFDRKKYSGFGYLNDDLSGDAEKELLHKCIVVEQSIAEGDFSLDEALEAYQLSKEDYTNYIARTSKDHIFISLSGSTAIPFNTAGSSYALPTYIDIFAKMFEESFDERLHELFGDNIENVKKELKGISAGIEKLEENT